ncbi:MAG: phage holin family protein [Bacteroidota bacterium]
MLKKIQDYLNTRILLLRLELSERFAKSLAALFKGIVLLMLFGIFLIFASIALALWIGDVFWNSVTAGFLAMAGFYLLIALIFAIFSKPLLENPFMNRVIKTLFETYKNDKTKEFNS